VTVSGVRIRVCFNGGEKERWGRRGGGSLKKRSQGTAAPISIHSTAAAFREKTLSDILGMKNSANYFFSIY